ncbi:MAG: NTP transferase domain-containing protein [Flavobacteriaceae bacterium]|nr:NTP transferase domain-containing protein [Flavobacteriaceae bacterium]
MDSPILILLAGGKSSRMGSPKGLLDFHGTLWILAQIASYKHIENPKVYIGLGYDYEQYLETIPWFKDAIENSYNYNGVEVKVVINDQPQLGSFSTLQAVMRNINVGYIIIVQPIDVPLPNEQSLTAIINENNTIVIPKYNGKNGHPVKLKPEFWKPLLTLDSFSSEARLDKQIKLFNTSSVTYLKVNDKSVYQNINTKEKWNYYLMSTKE